MRPTPTRVSWKYHWPLTCLLRHETFVKTNALQYYMHDGPTAFRFELAGDLSREGVRRLNQDWNTASSALGDRRLIVDMTFVTGVDEQARTLIARWHREGARLIANSAASRALAESILGAPLSEPPANIHCAAASDWTWRPYRPSFPWRAATSLLLATILFPVEAKAATLRPVYESGGRQIAAGAARTRVP